MYYSTLLGASLQVRMSRAGNGKFKCEGYLHLQSLSGYDGRILPSVNLILSLDNIGTKYSKTLS